MRSTFLTLLFSTTLLSTACLGSAARGPRFYDGLAEAVGGNLYWPSKPIYKILCTKEVCFSFLGLGMKAVFLGSIGVIAETSELQRQAYNAAFAEHGLDWYWSVANYCEMLKKPGGVNRIQSFSNGLLSKGEITAIHTRKEAFFSAYLRQGIAPRTGVCECISKCRENGIRLGFITTTTQNNIETLSHALKDHLKFTDFDLITTKDDVNVEKPSGDVYGYALNEFGLAANEVIAVEDTEINQAAALQEQILCYLFAGEYATTTHNLNAINSLEILAKKI